MLGHAEADQLPAAMEPWPFGHGEDKFTCPGLKITGAPQWSHGLSAMESGPALARSGCRACRNRAMAFRPWREMRPHVAPLWEVLAQWSHGLSAMESPKGST